MKQTKESIEKQLVFADLQDEFYFFDKADTKQKRTLVQNATFHRLVNVISDHTGYDMKELKLQTLIKLFWSKQVKWGWETLIVPNKTSTTELDKEEAWKFIEALITIWEHLKLWEIITPRELQSFKDTYN